MLYVLIPILFIDQLKNKILNYYIKQLCSSFVRASEKADEIHDPNRIY